MIIHSGSVLASISSPLSQIETFIWEASQKYNLPYSIILDLAVCEDSTLTHNNVWGKAGEYGSFQFMPMTFKSFADYYKMEDANWFSLQDQVNLAAQMIRDGYGPLWTCWK